MFSTSCKSPLSTWTPTVRRSGVFPTKVITILHLAIILGDFKDELNDNDNIVEFAPDGAKVLRSPGNKGKLTVKGAQHLIEQQKLKTAQRRSTASKPY